MSHGINKRVLKDIQVGQDSLKKEMGIYIAPEESNYYRVHFIIPGPEGTSFEGGLYHGMIRLNDNHPHSPPNIHMITPNGRFKHESHPIPASSRGICTSFTSYHPESWTPMNDIRTILKGFISFMCQPYDADGGSGIGGIYSTPEQTKKFAVQSINHLKSGSIIKTLFPVLYQQLIDGTYKPIKLLDLSNNVPIITSVLKPVKPITENLKIKTHDEPNKKTNKKTKVNKLITRHKKVIESDGDESLELSESSDMLENLSESSESSEPIVRKNKKVKKIESSSEESSGNESEEEEPKQKKNNTKNNTKSKSKVVKKSR